MNCPLHLLRCAAHPSHVSLMLPQGQCLLREGSHYELFWNKRCFLLLLLVCLVFAWLLISRVLLIFQSHGEAGSLPQVSTEAAALHHKSCSLLPQQIILHLQKHRLLCASLLCLWGEKQSPLELSSVGFQSS